MTYYINYIRDQIGNNYLGINIENGVVQPFLTELKEILGDKYDEYISNQKNRDHDSYHLTVINVMDFNRLTKEIGANNYVKLLEPMFKFEIDDLKMLGLGTATRNNNRAYFIVCKSEKLDAIRKRFELPPHDFHITLGFLFKDVFGVRKNEVIKKANVFLRYLAIEFYKNENWNFIKKIKNYNFDLDSELIPVRISESSIKFKCEGSYIDVIYLDDKFWVASKYDIDKKIEMKRMPETEIIKILIKSEN